MNSQTAERRDCTLLKSGAQRRQISLTSSKTNPIITYTLLWGARRMSHCLDRPCQYKMTELRDDCYCILVSDKYYQNANPIRGPDMQYRPPAFPFREPCLSGLHGVRHRGNSHKADIQIATFGRRFRLFRPASKINLCLLFAVALLRPALRNWHNRCIVWVSND